MHNYLIIKYKHCKNGQETYFVVQLFITKMPKMFTFLQIASNAKLNPSYTSPIQIYPIL